MVYYERYEDYDDEPGWCGYDDEGEDDERGELPTAYANPSGPCVVCSKADQQFACFRCGEPVCMDEDNIMNDTGCGGWIMDWWSNGAMDPDDGNEYWCKHCLERGE